MKRYLISSVVALVVLVVALVAFGQQSERRQRRTQYFQGVAKAIETIQEQAGKLKTVLEETAKLGKSIGNWQDLSEEERDKFREEMEKTREEWQEILEVIEQQFVILTPPRQLRAEHEESIAKLQAIHTLAVEEKAEKTTKHIEELIAKRNKEYEDTMKKLGLERLLRRR
ncbi:MAG: hypothetical protein ACYTFW_15260 [Planctomycetota bacterium]|jgi:hypothetical protein